MQGPRQGLEPGPGPGLGAMVSAQPPVEGCVLRPRIVEEYRSLVSSSMLATGPLVADGAPAGVRVQCHTSRNLQVWKPKGPLSHDVAVLLLWNRLRLTLLLLLPLLPPFLSLPVTPSAVPASFPRRLKQHSVRAGARAVILAPTRELALQVGACACEHTGAVWVSRWAWATREP